MTPDEALEQATGLDLEDDEHLLRRYELTVATRQRYRADRIERSAAIELCRSRGHQQYMHLLEPADRFACRQCRDDITAATRPPSPTRRNQ